MDYMGKGLSDYVVLVVVMTGVTLILLWVLHQTWSGVMIALGALVGYCDEH